MIGRDDLFATIDFDFAVRRKITAWSERGKARQSTDWITEYFLLCVKFVWDLFCLCVCLSVCPGKFMYAVWIFAPKAEPNGEKKPFIFFPGNSFFFLKSLSFILSTYLHTSLTDKHTDRRTHRHFCKIRICVCVTYPFRRLNLTSSSRSLPPPPPVNLDCSGAGSSWDKAEGGGWSGGGIPLDMILNHILSSHRLLGVIFRSHRRDLFWLEVGCFCIGQHHRRRTLNPFLLSSFSLLLKEVTRVTTDRQQQRRSFPSKAGN